MVSALVRSSHHIPGNVKWIKVCHIEVALLTACHPFEMFLQMWGRRKLEKTKKVQESWENVEYADMPEDAKEMQGGRALLLKSQIDFTHQQSSRDVPTYLPQNKA
eukprot:1193795-Prorocentrum_minimum.AAC.2